MSNFSLERRNRLRGKSIFLSASVPDSRRAEKFLRVPDAHIEIDEAVISLARAVLSEGGRIVYGGHPSISRLIAMVAGEYLAPRHAEKLEDPNYGSNRRLPSDDVLITIYQSRIFEKKIPNETMLLFKLGYASIVWIDGIKGERYTDDIDRSKPRFPQSLLAMRRRMIEDSQPVAMVCIGGMEGVIEEVNLFMDLIASAPVFLIAATGGATCLLSKEPSERMVVIDKEVQHRLKHKRKDLISPLTIDSETQSKRIGEKPRLEKRVIPYSLIMQEIVSRTIVRGKID